MKKILLAVAISLLIFFKGASIVKAADFNLDCGDSGCTKSGTEPIFSKIIDGYWFPGRTLTKTINLKNSSSTTREISMKPDRTSPADILENVVQVSIITNPGGAVIWAGSLDNFYSQTAISMGIFAPGADLNYDFTVLMSSGADNNYQNKETVFDLTLGFWGEPISTPTPAPGGGGGVLGAGVSTPVCTDTAPGGAPTLISAVAGTNSVTLTWNPAPDPVTYYLVTYGTSPGAQTYGNPNVGGHGATNYTVNGLSGGITYYFRVRAGNGCMPGPFSNELSAAAVGRVIAGPAVGFIPGVLGVGTQLPEVTPTPSAGAQVLGTECIKSKYPWWIFLVLEITLILPILRRGIILKWEIRKLIFSLVAIASLSQIVHEIMGCDCITSIWCSKYLWINLSMLLLSIIYTLQKSHNA
jgi:hypothetical protein